MTDSDLVSGPHSGQPWRSPSPCWPRSRALLPGRWSPSALCGFLITWFGTLWLGLGIRNRVLRGYRGFVLPGESLVVVEATEDEAADVIAVLRRIAHPSVFAIRPGPGFTASTETAGQRREPATMASLPDCAAGLATSHELESSTRSRPLLPILRECEVIIERARSGSGRSRAAGVWHHACGRVAPG